MATLDEFNGEVTLMVAADDDGEFLGLLAESGAGLFVRADNDWHTVVGNNPTFHGASLTYVDADSVKFFDKLEAKDREPTLEQMVAFADEDEEPAVQ